MKIGRPGLFYLFRRAFGLFLLLTGINSFCHTSTSPLDDSNDNTSNSTVHISIGTFVYGSEITGKTKSEEDFTKRKKNVHKRKRYKARVTSSIKKVSNSFSKYHYTPLDNEDFFRSITMQKTLFAYTDNHVKKKTELPAFWFSDNMILSYNYGINITHSLRPHFQNYQVRPP